MYRTRSGTVLPLNSHRRCWTSPVDTVYGSSPTKVYDELTFDDAFVSVGSVTQPWRVTSVCYLSCPLEVYAMTGWRVAAWVAPSTCRTPYQDAGADRLVRQHPGRWPPWPAVWSPTDRRRDARCLGNAATSCSRSSIAVTCHPMTLQRLLCVDRHR